MDNGSAIIFDLVATIFLYGIGPVILGATRKTEITVGKLRTFSIVYSALMWFAINAVMVLYFNGTVSAGTAAVIWGIVFFKVTKKKLWNKGLLVTTPTAKPPQAAQEKSGVSVSVPPVEEMVPSSAEMPCEAAETPVVASTDPVGAEKPEPVVTQPPMVETNPPVAKAAQPNDNAATPEPAYTERPTAKSNKGTVYMLVALFCLSFAGNIVLSYKVSQSTAVLNEQAQQIEKLTVDNNRYIKRIKTIKEQTADLEPRLAFSEERAKFLSESIAICPDDGTRLYHSYDCPELDWSYPYWAFNVEAASGHGFSPCPYCKHKFQ